MTMDNDDGARFFLARAGRGDGTHLFEGGGVIAMGGCKGSRGRCRATESGSRIRGRPY